jgi:hypothetical protein
MAALRKGRERSPTDNQTGERKPPFFAPAQGGAGFPASLRSPGLLKSLFILSCLLIVLLLLFALVSAWPFSTDDAYITLRYAANWASAGQLNWNLGDPIRVEGYSSSLYLTLGFLALKLSVSPIVLLKILSVAALMGAFALIFRLTRRQANPWFGLLAVLCFGTYFGTIWWGVSGLETATYILFILASISLYRESRTAQGKRGRGLLALTGFMVFLSGFTRPEGPVIGIVIGFFLIAEGVLDRRKLKDIVVDAAFLAAPFFFCYGFYFMARWSYFGAVWPNSYYFKTGYGGDPWRLIAMFFEVAAIPLIFGVVSLASPKSRRFPVFLYAYIGLTVGLLYGVDPVVAHHNRHALTALAALSILLSLALFELYKKKRRLASVLVLGLVVFLLATGLGNIGKARRESWHYAGRMDARARLAAFLNTLPLSSYAIGDAGLVPFLTPDKKVFDYYGLNSKAFTSPPINNDLVRYIAWLAEEKPDAVVVVSRERESLRPRNRTQRHLVDVFSKEDGYVDSGRSFGFERDRYQYRVLIRRQSVNGK